jgi:hypothetical protein
MREVLEKMAGVAEAGAGYLDASMTSSMEQARTNCA